MPSVPQLKVDDVGAYDFSVDKDLQEIWPEVVKKFENATKRKLDPNTTFAAFQDTVVDTINQSRSKRSSNARLVLIDVGHCLQQFGSIIAGQASMAFGPSAQCWNAISFIIAVAQKYSEVFDGFITLMERCSAFLSQLNVFLQKQCDQNGACLPVNLRKSAYAILSHFVEILASSYNLSNSKREKWKLFLDIVLFSGDAGVQDALECLEQQVQQFTNMQITNILVDLKGLAKYLLDSDEKRRQHQAEIVDYMQHIYGITEETLAVSQQTKITIDHRMTQKEHKEAQEEIRKAFDLELKEDPWTSRQRQLCNTRLKQSGRWIIDRDELGFSRWADGRELQGQTKVLTVQGDSGCGKTFITNEVITQLQEKYRSDNSTEQVSIAWYFYGEDSRGDSLERCLRCIILQLASNNPTYAKLVAKACQSSSRIAHAEDIWKSLVMNLQHTMKGAYYICIDGLENLGEHGASNSAIGMIVRDVLSGFKGMPVRLYLTGTDDAMTRAVQDGPGVQRILLGPVIDLGHKMRRMSPEEVNNSTVMVPVINSIDLEGFALAKIEEMGNKKPDLKSFVTEARVKQLVAGVHGHYEQLEAKLVQINACDDEQKIQAIIERTGDDSRTSIRRSLKVSIDSLSPEQIEQLNELLIWIAACKNTSIEFLQSALYLAFRRTLLLRDLVATTFSGFLTVDDETLNVKLKSEQFRQILREETQSHPNLAHTGVVVSELSQPEINLCSDIIKNVCGDRLFDRFRFDEYFGSLAGKQRFTVRLDDDDSLNVAITRSLLQALCESTDRSHLEPLRKHASIWFYEYLKVFVERLDYFEPNRESLSQIGTSLSRVLHDPDSAGLCEIWLSDGTLTTVRTDLVDQNGFLEPMQKLLRNPHVAKGYAHDLQRKEWIETVISGKAGSFDILSKISRTLAIKWFTCDTLTDPNCLHIPYSVFSKTTGQPETNEGPSVPSIEKFLQWVAELTGLDPNSPVWSYRVGATYRVLGHDKDALQIFRGIEHQFTNNWGFLLITAETIVDLKDYPAAIAYLHKLKSLHSELIDTEKGFRDAYGERILLAEADCYRKSEDFQSAVKCYQDIIDQDIGYEPRPGYVHTQALKALFEIWDNDATHIATLTLLRELRDDKKAGRGLTYWLGNIMGSSDVGHGHVFKAAKRLGAVEEISQMYDAAIKPDLVTNGETPKASNGNTGILRFYQAALLWKCSDVDEDHAKALGVWEELASNTDETWEGYWVAFKTCWVLGPALLDEAASKVDDLEDTTLKSNYAETLEALCNSNQQSVRNSRQSELDTRLCLIRLYMLSGDAKLADEHARNLLRGVFDEWPPDGNDESLSSRFRVLAQVLTVYGLHDDAVAAWQALKPREPVAKVLDQKSDHGTSPSDDGDKRSNGTSTANADSSKLETHPVRSPESASDFKPEAYLTGFRCDSCSKTFPIPIADNWICSHCLDVQLCTPCHLKLLDDDISPLVCSKKHTFVHLPTFDIEQHASLPDGMILVGGKQVLRDEWLNQLREKWDLQQEKIDTYKLESARNFKAIFVVSAFVKKWLRRRRSKLRVNYTRAHTAPLP